MMTASPRSATIVTGSNGAELATIWRMRYHDASCRHFKVCALGSLDHITVLQAAPRPVLS